MRQHILVGPDKLVAKPLQLTDNAYRFDQPRRGYDNKPNSKGAQA